MTKEEIKIPAETLEYLQCVSNNQETYTREEVYKIAVRCVHAFINGILTANCKSMEQIVNSEIETVKLF